MAPQGPSRQRHGHGEREASKSRKKPKSTLEDTKTAGSSRLLSADALAQLNRHNARNKVDATAERLREADGERERRKQLERRKERGREGDQELARERARQRGGEERKRRRDSGLRPAPIEDQQRVSRSKPKHRDEYRELGRHEKDGYDRNNTKRKKRIVSGAILEEGKGRLRGGAGGSSHDSVDKDDPNGYQRQQKSSKKRIWMFGGVGLVLLVLIIVVAVVVSKKNSGNDNSGLAQGNSPSLSNVTVPAGTPAWLDPHTWADTTDFNLTYTDAMVGNLPVMGLFSAWDDSAAANELVPALNKAWGSYTSRPARGVNLGGWLSLEPFITPSLFDYDSNLGIIDEWTLSKYLDTRRAATLEKHYATFVTESTFKEIAAAGLDHIRIPFSYWAVQTYDDDPYLYRTSWRYLLRGIEWARKYGLRVNLDLHGLPGSQNGWNHSGRQGAIGWFNGTNGAQNAQRSLDVHDRLSKFFAQDRYKNIISHYGLANEPRMTFLSVTDVLDWTTTAYKLVRKNGVADAVVVFGDGFRGLAKWQGELSGLANMALDVHQYVIFNTNQIVYNHSEKVAYACSGWTEQTEQSMSTATGFGPTLTAEWSQADTDCAHFLTNVGWGNRWTGTYVTGNASLDITTPRCPTENTQCVCGPANAAADAWSPTYKQFLLMFAEAQMSSFEKGWGWWYWTWDTESAPQWSYKKGLAAGVLPAKAYQRTFDCSSTIPNFDDLPEFY